MERKYKLGDKWSSDFDYEGMLQTGLKADISWGYAKLRKLFDSFEDVNYHSAGKPLWKALMLLKELKEKDATKNKEAIAYISEFHKLIKEEIAEIDNFAKGGTLKANDIPLGTMLEHKTTKAEVIVYNVDTKLGKMQLMDVYGNKNDKWWSATDWKISRSKIPVLYNFEKQGVDKSKLVSLGDKKGYAIIIGNLMHRYDDKKQYMSSRAFVGDQFDRQKFEYKLRCGGKMGSGGTLGVDYYITWSSWFDKYPYDVERMTKALNLIGATNIHLEPENGQSNQPEVVVFNYDGDKEDALVVLKKEFETGWIFVREKDWKGVTESHKKGSSLDADAQKLRAYADAEGSFKKGGYINTFHAGAGYGTGVEQLSFDKKDYHVNIDLKTIEVDVNIDENDSVDHSALNDTGAKWNQERWGYMIYPKTKSQLYAVLKALKVQFSKERVESALYVGKYCCGGQFAKGGAVAKPYSQRFFDVIETRKSDGVIVRQEKNLNTYKAEEVYFKMANTHPVRRGYNNVKMVEITKDETQMAQGGNVTTAIKDAKNKLIAKAKAKGLYENFGQKEVRMLEDKYGNTPEVRAFDNWCMNFDLSQMAQGGNINTFNYSIGGL